MLVPWTSTINVIKCKWIFLTKYNVDDSVAHYKAHLVVKGFHQIEGFNFSKIFRPVVTKSTIHFIFQLATTLGLYLQQLDVKNVFLHDELQETLYMFSTSGIC